VRASYLFLVLALAGAVLSLGAGSAPALAADVTLMAIDRPGGSAVNGEIAWSVFKVDKMTGKAMDEASASGTGPRLQTQLSPGQYVVMAKLGETEARQAILIGVSTTTRSLVLAQTGASAGGPPAKLSIGMILHKGQKKLRDPVRWEIFTYDKAGTDAGKKVTEQTVATGNFSLPAGSYVIRAHYQGTRADLVVPLQAGQSLEYTINLYAGYAKLLAIQPTGARATAKALNWRILRLKPNQPGVYELVMVSDKATPKLLLREGTYLVVADLGGNMWGSEKLVVSAGKTQSLKVKLKSGKVSPELSQLE
jgi:hypothetical protein